MKSDTRAENSINKDDFKVSFIAPVRNEEPNIRRFIESLLAQSFPPQEIIIVDGGSVDRTKEIVKEMIQTGHPIRLIEDRNAYPGRARNLGLQAARYEWVAMSDAGIFVEPDWLDNLARVAVGDDVDVVLGTYEPIMSNLFKTCLALVMADAGKQVDGRWVRGPSTASMMLKKQVWAEVGKFPEELRACEDLLFFDRLRESSFKIKYAPDAVVRWEISDHYSGVFRKFRTYSLHTLKAGLWRRWHVAIARMYAVGFICIILAIFHHWFWAVLPVTGLCLRAYKGIRLRRQSLKIEQPIGIRAYLLIMSLLIWIDGAALFGVLDYCKLQMSQKSQVEHASYSEARKTD